MMARRILNGLYAGCGYLAALCLASIALTIIAQVCGRFVGVAVDSTESAGFFLAGATFLGLAHTFRHGDHIRVTLLTRYANGVLERLLHLWAIAFCVVAMAYMTWWAFDLVYFSFVFGDKSPGLLAVPFWIPRSVMATGVLVFTVALVDELVCVAAGAVPSYVANEESVLDAASEDDVADAARGVT